MLRHTPSLRRKYLREMNKVKTEDHNPDLGSEKEGT
jgi:hypothetical protein